MISDIRVSCFTLTTADGAPLTLNFNLILHNFLIETNYGLITVIRNDSFENIKIHLFYKGCCKSAVMCSREIVIKNRNFSFLF